MAMYMSHIQAIIFNKLYFTKRQADHWLKRHDFERIKPLHETVHYYRARLKEPNTRYEYRIKSLTRGVKAVIGFT